MATAVRPSLRTPLRDRLGIRYPIGQAGMGVVGRSAPAPAVAGTPVPVPTPEGGDVEHGTAACGPEGGAP